jgi:hypothetical protein
VPSSPPPTTENNTQNLLNLGRNPCNLSINSNLLKLLDEPPSSSNNPTSSSTILDPLQELFTTSPTKTEENTDIVTVFSSSNDNGGVLSNEKIMALFNIPQTSTAMPSGVNIRPPSNRMY